MTNRFDRLVATPGGVGLVKLSKPNIHQLKSLVAGTGVTITDDGNGLITLGVASGTFAARPSAPAAGTQYFASDLGTGILLIYTGSKWKPINGEAILYQSGVNTTPTTASAETNHAVVTIPAGLLSANGGLEISTAATFTGTAGTKNPIQRHSATSGAVAGGTGFFNTNLTASTLSSAQQKFIINQNSVSAQTCNGNASVQGASISSGTTVTGTIDTSAVSYINFNMSCANNSVDTGYYNQIIVKWIEG